MQLYCFYVIVDQIFGLGNPDPFLIKLHVFYYDFVIYYIMYSNIHYSSLFLPLRHLPYHLRSHSHPFWRERDTKYLSAP